MTRKNLALTLNLGALLLAAALPASAQGAREEASLADLVRLLQSQDAIEEELAAALTAAESLLGDPFKGARHVVRSAVTRNPPPADGRHETRGGVR